jgi:hypothetical protein
MNRPPSAMRISGRRPPIYHQGSIRFSSSSAAVYSTKCFGQVSTAIFECCHSRRLVAAQQVPLPEGQP